MLTLRTFKIKDVSESYTADFVGEEYTAEAVRLFLIARGADKGIKVKMIREVRK